jgi:hypothetical protein
VVALLLTGDPKQDVNVTTLDLNALPKDVEVLDRKDVGGR